MLSKNKKIGLLMALALIAAFFIGFSGINGVNAKNVDSPQFPTQSPTPAPLLVQGLPDFTALVETVGPSVVNIKTMSKAKSANMSDYGDIPPEMQEFFEFFFNTPNHGWPTPNAPQDKREKPEDFDLRPSGVASGFILTADGYIMTNAHVVEQADELIVTLPNNAKEYQAKVIGADKRTDVALIKIEGVANLPVVRIGNAEALKVGEWVVAIGSPFGLDNSVTAGIVSAKQRDTGSYINFIQTDVAVNPGNSGGPLINLGGEVVGINSQIYSRSGGFMGISFSIPIDEAMGIAQQLREQGYVERGRIGVTITPVTPDVAKALGLGDEAYGTLIHSVEAGGRADKAGVQAGDIITEVAGKRITNPKDLQKMIGDTKPGSQTKLKILRKGKWLELNVTVDALPIEGQKVAAAKTPEKPKEAAQEVAALGVSIADLTSTQKAELKIDSGIVITAVSAHARRAGLREGDLILAVGNTEVKDVAQFKKEVQKMTASNGIALLVQRGSGVAYIIMQPAS